MFEENVVECKREAVERREAGFERGGEGIDFVFTSDKTLGCSYVLIVGPPRRAVAVR